MSMDQKYNRLNWRKSSYSGTRENCVEAAALPSGGVAIRDSKNPSAPYLTVTPAAWRQFLDQVRNWRE